MVELSFFYFADDGAADHDRYRLLLDGARFADEHGFAGVWTPERHFHPFGGLFPNPAVTAAAVAAVTKRIGIRAGSVVAPLHHPLRIAEEWSVVDNISGGRAGISLASGWHPRDFVLRPEAYEDRKQRTVDVIGELRRLWAGESYSGSDAAPGEQYRVFPPPVQATLPMWLTSSGAADTFEAAGKSGVGVLTHLLTQSVEDLATKIAAYRGAYAASGQPGRGHVTLMMHTYLDTDLDAAEQVVREPLYRYLASSLDLNVGSVATKDGTRRQTTLTESRARAVSERAYERYLRKDGLFGSVEDALPVVRRIAGADVDEIACLIDFGVPVGDAVRGFRHLDALRKAAE